MFHHLLLDGFADGSLGAALDVLSTAAHLSGTSAAGARRVLRQRVVSLDGKQVRSSAGRVVPVDGSLEPRSVHRGDVVLLPGVFSESARTVDALLQRSDVQGAAVLLSKLAGRGVVLAASCSSTFVLAQSGVLDGREATTSWWLAPEFARRFPAVTLTGDRMVVDEGRVLTAGASLAHVDLTLALVTRLVGPSLANLTARYLVLDERESQARYVVLEHLRSDEPALRELERFVLKNVHRQLSVRELARAARLSERTLARRLHASLNLTPQAFVQRLRVRRAVDFLETTRAPIEQVAAQVGYADAAAFRRVFRRYAGQTPRAARLQR